MSRIPDSKDAGGEDGEGEKSLQRGETLGLLLPATDGLTTADLWSQERLKRKKYFILCKADVSSNVLLFDLPQGEHLISHMPSCLPGVCLWLASAVLQTLHSFHTWKYPSK